MKISGKSLFLPAVLCSALLFCTAAAAAPLTVVNAMPRGEVSELSQITVTFDDVMRSLGAMEQEAGDAPLHLATVGAPLPPGNFRWLDPSTLAYIFDAPVSFPLELTATVPKGSRSLSGKTLRHAVTWNISTPALTLRVFQREKTILPKEKNAVIRLQANYPLNEALLRTKTRLTADGEALPFTITAHAEPARLSGRAAWRQYDIAVGKTLPPNTFVALNVDAGVAAEGGGIPAGAFFAEIPAYRTLALESRLAGGRKLDEALGNVSPEAPVTLVFNNPVSRKELLARVRVNPEAALLPDAAEGGALISPYQPLPYAWKPRATYTVTVAKGLTDEYGTALPAEETFTFTTGDCLPLAHVPGGYDAVMETPLADLFPVAFRNAGKVTLSLRYVPWGNEALTLMRDDTLTPSRPVSGTRESEIIFDLAKIPNTILRENVNIPKTLGFSSAKEMNGIVVLATESDFPAGAPYRARTWLQFTNLGLAVRIGEKSGIVWTADIADGNPVGKAAVRITDAEGKTLWQGETSGSGVALTPGYEKLYGARFCMAESPLGTSVLDLGKYLVPSSAREHEIMRAHRVPWQIHAVAQVPLYQPGQKVNAVILARRHADSGKNAPGDFADWKALADTPLQLEVRDRRNVIVHTAEGKTDAYGTLPLSFTLPLSAEPGWYGVTAKVGGTEESTAYAFQVASFRPPDFKVDLAAPASRPVPGAAEKPLSAGIAAEYFAGSAVKNGEVTLDITEQETFFAPEKLRGYRVGPNARPYHRTPPRVSTVAGNLDAQGAATLPLPAFKTENQRPLNVFLSASVTDAARLVTQGTASFMLHPSEYYVGLRAPFVALPGREEEFRVKAATWDDNTVAGKTVTVTAKRITRDGDALKETPAWERAVLLADGTGTAFTATFETAGEYAVTASVADDAGRVNVAVARVYVPGSGGDWMRTKPARRLEFVYDDAVYSPGATARVVVRSPFETAAALVTIERDGVLRSFVTTVSGPAPLLEIPLEKTDAPYVYATVTLVKGRTAPPPDAAAPAGTADDGAPALAQGTLLFKVEGAREKLAAAITASKEEYRPGDAVKAEIRVTDGAGKGKKSQVSVLAVDERYLRAAGERTLYDPSSTFSEQFPGAANGTDIWRHLLDRGVPPLPGAENLLRAALAPAAYMDAREPARGAPAGRGGAEKTPLRADFTPLAFWLPAGETDASGKLSVSFTLPDSVTAYRLVVVARDAKSAFAVGETSIRASKTLQIHSALPRFVTEGDTIFAAALVQNTGKTRGEATLSARIEGTVPVFGPKPHAETFFLEAGESRRVAFALKAGPLSGTEGNIILGFSASMRTGGMTETDAARFVLPVKPAAPLTAVAAAGTVAEGKSVSLPVSVPAGAGPRGGLDLILAPSPAAGAPLAAKQVMEYPWNCLEQRLSRAWARMLRLSHANLLGLTPDAEDAAKIAEELAAVPSYQAGDGSFRLWPGFAEGDFFLTGYVLLVNAAAREAGRPLPEETTARALANIERRLESLAGEHGRPEEDPEAAAFALYALSLHEPEKARRLLPAALAYCKTRETGPFGLASLLLALHPLREEPGMAETAAALRKRLEKTAAVTSTELHFASPRESVFWRTLGSSLRDNAFVLAALAGDSPAHPHVDALARWVGRRLGETRTLSTQEAVFGMYGLTAFLQRYESGGGTAASAFWNGREEMRTAFRGLSDAPVSARVPAERLDAGHPSKLRVTAEKGRPCWTARLWYADPAAVAKTENAGFAITRMLERENSGETERPEKTPWKIGDVVTVRLTVTVPATRHHVALFDPFPAGMEPLSATRTDEAEREKTWQPPWRWQDALEDGMLLYAPRMDPGTYTFTYRLRAASGGTFVHRPAAVEEMYTPETFGRTAAATVTVTE